MSRVIGWDIGGANVKAALAEDGVVTAVVQRSCAPHQGLANLEDAIRDVAARLGHAERHGVTMTAELSDAFEDRRRGVVSIAAIVAHELAASADIGFYAGSDGFLPRAAVRDAADAIASANWRASAELAARHFGEALLVDMGSTTTDIVPLRGGAVVAMGASDSQRLAAGELCYAGFLRGSPLAYAQRAPIAGRWMPLVNEQFAAMADVRRVLGTFGEGGDSPTADGRPATVEASCARLARLAGCDGSDATPAQWRAFAAFLEQAQLRAIEDQTALVLSREMIDGPIVAAGVGRSLIATLAAGLGFACRDFSQCLPTTPDACAAAADCAPAAAVALLYR